MQLPSPLQQVTYNNISFDMKRDDMIDPFVSGNKWRKLKHILIAANRQNKNHIVTFGGAYSNHLLATAAACAKFGLKCTAFVRGEFVQNEMLMLCKLYGMELIFVDRESYKDKTALFNGNFGNDQTAFFVNEGGANTEALLGCAEIVEELPQVYDNIICAAGTGTTAAGILGAITKHQLPTRLHVISVLKGDFMYNGIKNLHQQTDQLTVHSNYHFGGYAKADDKLFTFLKDFTAKTGILLDPVYTAKAMYGFLDLMANNTLNSESKNIFIHTGGLFGIFGMKDKIQRLL